MDILFTDDLFEYLYVLYIIDPYDQFSRCLLYLSFQNQIMTWEPDKWQRY